MKSGVVARLVGLSALAVVFAFTPGVIADEKIKVENLDDLPRFSYPVEGSVVGIITSEEAFDEFAAKVRTDIEGVLAAYDISDAATLKDYYRVLSRLDLMEGRLQSVLDRAEKIRQLEEKEAARLTTGLFAGAWVEAAEEVEPAADFEAFAGIFADRLEEGLTQLPWEVVQDEIKEAKGRAEIFSSESFVLGLAQSQVDPAVTASGAISSDLVPTVIALRYMLTVLIPVNYEVIEVYEKHIEANKVQKKNIWYEREAALGIDKDNQEVKVAIWDSGVDVSVFENLLWINPSEVRDGTDSDTNGYIDDINGIAYDKEGNRTPFLLHPEGDMAGRVEEAMRFTKGFMDITAAIDSKEASELKRHLGTIEPANVNDFLESLSFAALYMHGTHVAGIAVEDNPYARIVVARLSFDYHNPPMPLSLETATRLGASFKNTIRYFRRYGIRVANMSWGWSLKEIESGLEANGVGESPEERAELASQFLKIMSDALYKAMAEARNTLFVAAAGNSDNDVEFDQMIPSSFKLPNLLVVGAVDQAGDPTGFTSQGRNVRLYANGFEVDSYVPGGGRMEASGTSMSAPQVVNLAAKILAVEPRMAPEAVVELILEGATPRDGDQDFLLLHPRETMALLEEKRKNKNVRRELKPDRARMEVN